LKNYLVNYKHEGVDIEGVVSADQIVLGDFHISIAIHSGNDKKILGR